MTGFLDWREPSSYAALCDADPSLLAWEWLRRTPAYRQAFNSSVTPDCKQRDASSFGLHRFEDPALGVPNARPVWSAEYNPFVIQARGLPAKADGNTIDLEPLRPMLTIVPCNGTNHLLISDGLGQVRLDLARSCPLSGPVCLSYSVIGLATMQRSIHELGRWVTLIVHRRFERPQARKGQARLRQVALLRAFDGLAAGASQRDLAEILIDADAGRSNWRLDMPSVRSRVQRLARASRALAAGGFRKFLHVAS